MVGSYRAFLTSEKGTNLFLVRSGIWRWCWRRRWYWFWRWCWQGCRRWLRDRRRAGIIRPEQDLTVLKFSVVVKEEFFQTIGNLQDRYLA